MNDKTMTAGEALEFLGWLEMNIFIEGDDETTDNLRIARKTLETLERRVYACEWSKENYLPAIVAFCGILGMPGDVVLTPQAMANAVADVVRERDQRRNAMATIDSICAASHPATQHDDIVRIQAVVRTFNDAQGARHD